MKKHLILCPALLLVLVLVTGCPRNEYIVELTPRGNVIERKLTFYRSDGTTTNGTPDYQPFPSNELAVITGLYPPASLKHEGERHIVTGQFAGAMPNDVGGAGSYTNLSTSLGNAGFYVERFRGNDDPTGMIEKRFRAADQLTDLVIGWSQVEFGREPHFKELRQFLDVPLRRDLKNLGSYFAPLIGMEATRKQGVSEVESSQDSEKALEEAAVRFGQYLVERGYVKTGEVPGLLRLFVVRDDKFLARLLQRFVAGQLKVPESAAMPKSLARFADPDALAKSWEEYLVKTEFYKAKVREVVTSQEQGSTPDTPKPSDVTLDLFLQVAGLKVVAIDGTDDHLIVTLSLPSPPAHTNGRWDEALKQVLWDSRLEGGTDSTHLPALCYASWSNPDEGFQQKHFGRVILSQDSLLEYCLWRAGLDEKQAAEWEALLAGLRPDAGLNERLEAFRFSGERLHSPSNSPPILASTFPRALIQAALQATP